MIAKKLITASGDLCRDCQKISFGAPATVVYHPLQYARAPGDVYLRRYANAKKRVIFLGINPGPWGMAQTGIPFGEVTAVREWLGINEKVLSPKNEHPMRPVSGFNCPRSEVSGRRLWGLFAKKFGAAENFFGEHFVLNYCPLLFLQAAKNRCTNLTPDKLADKDAKKLYAVCDIFLQQAVAVLQPTYLIGVGGFAEQRLKFLFGDEKFSDKCGGEKKTIGKILHPSPASPAANKDFAKTATMQLEKLGVW